MKLTPESSPGQLPNFTGDWTRARLLCINLGSISKAAHSAPFIAFVATPFHKVDPEPRMCFQAAEREASRFLVRYLPRPGQKAGFFVQPRLKMLSEFYPHNVLVNTPPTAPPHYLLGRVSAGRGRGVGVGGVWRGGWGVDGCGARWGGGGHSVEKKDVERTGGKNDIFGVQSLHLYSLFFTQLLFPPSLKSTLSFTTHTPMSRPSSNPRSPTLHAELY